MVIAVGSQNTAKLRSAQMVAERLFPDADVKGVSVSSGVSAQPLSDEECMQGAIHRARAAREALDADYGIGMEGGANQIGEKWFECGWIAVVNREGKIGLGTSARFEISARMAEELRSGKELAEIIDELTGRRDVRSQEGAMGIITNGHLPRDLAYTHGLFFAFGPFISTVPFWD